MSIVVRGSLVGIEAVVTVGGNPGGNAQELAKMSFRACLCRVTGEADDGLAVERDPPLARLIIRLNQVELIALRDRHAASACNRCAPSPVLRSLETLARAIHAWDIM
jgi:hypothetical protein